MKDKIIMQSRYGDNRTFSIIDEDTIEVTGNFAFMRAAYFGDNTEYYFIDPDGGPFISICGKLYLEDMVFEVFKISAETRNEKQIFILKVIKLK